jgi:DNA-binding NtrC family response regulator
MGGRIWVESEEGKGTQFHFNMILNSAEAKPSELLVPTIVRDIPAKERKCLLIEHSRIVRDLLMRDIQAVFLEGIAVDDVSAARDHLNSTSFRVVIVDSSLTGSDTLVKELGETTPDTRVIRTSNLGTVTDLTTNNLVTTLVKPIRRWRLVKALEKAISRAQVVPIRDADLTPPKDLPTQGLATLAFRHPLRILVLALAMFF